MNGRPWTEAEDALLRARYPREGSGPCGDALGRSTTAIQERARAIGVVCRARWSDAEDARLAMMWGVYRVDVIARTIGRTIHGVWYRAGLLKLGLGCPQGHETIEQAARRAGYDRATLRKILRWARVRVDRAFTRDALRLDRRKGVRRVVETTDVDDAVARWCETEIVSEAARRLDIHPTTLRRLLREAIAAGDERVPPPPTDPFGKWRVPSALCDELLAASRGGESLADAARRVGRAPDVLARGLRAAGIRVGRGVRLATEDVDRVSTSMPRRRRPTPIGRAA